MEFMRKQINRKITDSSVWSTWIMQLAFLYLSGLSVSSSMTVLHHYYRAVAQLGVSESTLLLTAAGCIVYILRWAWKLAGR